MLTSTVLINQVGSKSDRAQSLSLLREALGAARGCESGYCVHQMEKSPLVKLQAGWVA